MILAYIILSLINICSITFLDKKKVKKDVYSYENYQYILKHVDKVVMISNIFCIIINLFYLISLLMGNIGINIINLVFFVLLCVTFICYLSRRQIAYISNYILLGKKKNNKITYIIINNILILLICSRIENISDFSLFLYAVDIVLFLLTICNFIILFMLLYKNKNILSFTSKESDYLTDIKYYKKIELNKILNYIILIIVYILIFCVNFPYLIFINIFIIVLFFIVIFKKIKKIDFQFSKLYRNISILKVKPGVKYAFDFLKDVYNTKELMIGVGAYIISVLLFYMSSMSTFTYCTLNLFICLIYIIFTDKIVLINYICSLNSDFIDTKIYKIKQNKKISYINEINIKLIKFQLKMYKLIYIDNNKNIFESNIILYDPELYKDNIDIYINPGEIKDNIIIVSDLYD